MTSHAQIAENVAAARAPFYRRILFLLTVFLTLLLLALLPPFLNVNRLQRRITTSISASLGRPVHFDNVTLNLLPIPSFTIDNFVVSEDPAFGYEPTIRANSVTARLRVSTLWRRRIEISRITFTEPSVNLVHTSDGRWNLDSILLQAAHIDSAPTAQTAAGPTPRFPYIEATGARLNLKLDNRKTPFSLTEADFALWLPSPETWHFRIAARPARTDIPEGYSGLLRVEGTLGRAQSLTRIPVDLHAEWRTAPLGEVSRILLGHDANWRGDMTLDATLLGTVGANTLHTTLRLSDVRRAAFVPAHLLNLTAECEANLTSAFTSMPRLQCAIPGASTQPALTLTASSTDLRNATPTTLQATLNPIPAATLTPLLQSFSARIPASLALGGVLSGTLDCDAPPCDLAHLQGSVSLMDASLAADQDNKAPILLNEIALRTSAQASDSVKKPSRRSLAGSPPQASSADLLLTPTTISLGSREPVELEGSIDENGLTLHLAGSATLDRLRALAAALPQFADNFPQPPTQPTTTTPQPIHLDYTLTRTWAGTQTWQPLTTKPAPTPHPRGRRRK